MSISVITSTVPCASCEQEERQKNIQQKQDIQASREAAATKTAELAAGVGQRLDISV
ncbi:MAG: hypothetical protein K2X10_14550 [Hyphomicrobiales bacterium]|nr:hypothetical protein [Hyphomicrobiales bacterium]